MAIPALPSCAVLQDCMAVVWHDGVLHEIWVDLSQESYVNSACMNICWS